MGSERLYKTIYELARVINLSLKPEEVLQRIVEQVTESMDAKGCFIRMLDNEGKTLLPSAYYGLSDRYAEKGPVEVAKSKLDAEVLEGNVVQIADVRSDDRFQYPGEAEKEGLVSMVVVPLTKGGRRVIGAVRVYSEREREFTQEELDFLSCIANLSGLAIENARMFHALKTASELAEAYTYQVFED